MTDEPCCYGFVTSRGQEHEVDCPNYRYPEHSHHWVPRRAGLTPQGEPRYVLACAHCQTTHRAWLAHINQRMGGPND